MMNMVSDAIQLPIRAGNVFRLLDMRTTADDPGFLEAFFRQFDQFLEAIKQTERLKPSRKADFLNYRNRHDPKLFDKPRPEMTEEELCAAKNGFMAERTFPLIGRVIDYQIPLNSTSTSGEGVVDLISEKDNLVYVVEAKKFKSNEPPIRAFVEALTFWALLVDNKKLVKGNAATFIRRYNESAMSNHISVDPESAILVPAVLLKDDSRICGKELKKFASERRGAKLFDLVRCFSYDQDLNVNLIDVKTL